MPHWPNQFIRACHHNSVFFNDHEGTGSLGPHSTEPLESGNHWIKKYDEGFTFKGNRQESLKHIFKLRRLKSSPESDIGFNSVLEGDAQPENYIEDIVPDVLLPLLYEEFQIVDETILTEDESE